MDECDEPNRRAAVEQRELDAGGIAKVTRRSFILGSVATAISTSAIAQAQSFWTYAVERDGADRFTYLVYHPSLGGGAEAAKYSAFSERTFGDTARILVTPRLNRSGGVNKGGEVDFVLQVRGATLLPLSSPDRAFDLSFHFFHDADNKYGGPSIDVRASGWLFGNSRLLASKVAAADWLAAPIPINGKTHSLASRLLKELFGNLPTLPRSGSLALSMVPPRSMDDPFALQVGLVRDPVDQTDGRDRFSLAIEDSNPLLEREQFERKTIAHGSFLEIWRERALYGDRDRGRPNEEKGAVLVDPADAAVGPKTRARLHDARRAGPAVALAEHVRSGEGWSSASNPVLSEHTILGTPLLERFATASGGEVITASIAASGKFLVATSHSLRPEDRASMEGPFPVQGHLELIQRIGALDRVIQCRLAVGAGTFRINTNFGSFSAQAPEPRRLDSSARREAPPLRLVADGFHHLRQFEISVSILDASITLPENELGFGNPAPISHHFARLDFVGGAHVVFHLHGLDDAGARHQVGRVLLGYSGDVDPALQGFPCSLPMEQAKLQLVRTQDLVALKYRFLGLDLVTDGKVSALMPRGPAVVARMGAEATSLTGPVADPRPTIVVELPPQHRAEQAFFQLRETRPTPPKLPGIVRAVPAIEELLLGLHAAYPAEGDDEDALSRGRIAARRQLLATLLSKVGATELPRYDELSRFINSTGTVKPLPVEVALGTDKDVLAFLDFVQAYAQTFVPTEPAEWKQIPTEQRLYVGREFLDPEAQLLAELVQDRERTKDPNQDVVSALIDRLPVDPVSTEELEAIKQNHASMPNAADRERAIADALAGLTKAREPGFIEFKAVYDPAVGRFLTSPGALPAGLNDVGGISKFEGRERLRGAVLQLRQKATKLAVEPALATWLVLFKEFIEKLPTTALTSDTQSETETPTPTAASRLSGPSRLAFRVNTDDYETGGRNGTIPFTVDDLTNFSRFELQVVRRAQKLFHTYKNGVRRPLWDLEEDLDLGNMLVHQGFSRGGNSRLKIDPDNLEGDPPWEDALAERSWREERITVDQRLAEVAASASEPPGELETAIELPFRLVLSPSQDAMFRTPRGVPPELFGERLDDTGNGIPPGVGLWTAELDQQSDATLRAVWSPDFRPEAFLPQDTARHGFFFPRRKSRVNRSPVRGPYAPWAMGRHLSSSDLKAAAAELGAHRFRTSLDAFDRHELVALTSLHGLPVMGRVSMTGTRLGKDQREPPPGFQVSLMGQPSKVDLESIEFNDVYVPRRLDPEGLELALTSLGGYLNVNASFEPPAAIVDFQRGSLFDALSIERWRHTIVLGRDISAEVVYKGYLMPFGIRAALIKSTERVFELVPGREGPIAILRQRMFIRIANPVKEYPAFRQPDEGRRLPFRKIRVLTTQTPDIVDPFDLSGAPDDTGVWPGGLIDLGPRDDINSAQPPPPGTPFWPRTARRKGAEVMFEILLDETNKVRIPLVFVDNVTANNATSLEALTGYYGLLGKRQGKDSYRAQNYLVQRPLFGQKIILAPSLEQGDTQFEVDTMTFGVEGRRLDTVVDPPAATYVPELVNLNYRSDAFMQGVDQPPFYPTMRRASVRVGQIERMTGQLNGTPVTVGYDSTYALAGFDPPAGTPADSSRKVDNPRSIFLTLAEPVPMKFGNSGDRGGAVSRPEANVVALSRSRGPIGNSDGELVRKPENIPAGGEFAPLAHQIKDLKGPEFFPDSATILGLVKVKDVLEVAAALLGIDLEPKLQEIVEFGGGLGNDADAFVRENVLRPLDGALQDFESGLQRIEFNGQKGFGALNAIYPEVGATFADFRASARDALSAPPPSAGIDASIRAYSAVYSRGGRFASAIERASRDPLTPIREAFRGKIEGYVSKLKTDLADVLAQVQALYAPPRLREQLIVLLKSLLSDQVGSVSSELAHLVFRLPIGDSLPTGSEKLATAALERSFAQAIDGTKVWNATPGQQLFSVEEFGKAIAAALEVEAMQSGLPQALADWLAQRASALRAQTERLTGLLWDLFSDTMNALTRALDPLADLALINIDRAIAGLALAGDAIAVALDKLAALKRIGDALGSQCEQLVDTLDSYVRSVLPIDASQVDVSVCLPEPGVPLDWAACQNDPDVPRVYKAVAAVSRLADSLTVLVDRGFGKLDKLIADVRHEGVADVDRALNALRELQKHLTDPKTDPRAKIAKARTDLVASAKRLHAIGKAYSELYQANVQELKATCQSPNILFGELIAPTIELDAERRKAIAAMRDAAELIAALFGVLATDIPDSGKSHAGVPGPTVFAVVPDLGAKKPNLDLDPKDWSWDVASTDVPNTVYHLERAKKEILGAILPALNHAAALFADLSSLAGYITTEADAQRVAAKERMEAALRSLSSVLTLDNELSGRLAAAADQLVAVASLQVVADLNADLSAWRTSIIDIRKQLVNPDTPLSNIMALKELQRQTIKLPDLANAVLTQAIGEAKKTGDDLLQELKEGLEARLATFLLEALSRGDKAHRKAIEAIEPTLQKLAGKLATGFEALRQERDKVVASLGPSDPSDAFASINQALKLLLVACPLDPSKPTEDLLAFQARTLTTLASADAETAAKGLLQLIRAWGASNTTATVCVANDPNGPNAVLVIFNQVAGAVDTLVRRDFSKLIDLGAIRRAVEDKLKQLIPSRVTLAYDLDFPLSEWGGIFLPAGPESKVFPGAPQTHLTLRARTIIDLLSPSTPRVDVSGQMGPFAVKLVGDLDVITLKFDGARYGNETGGKFKTNITGVDLGEMVAFLDQFSQYFSFGGNGFYIAVRFDLPGIEAGYRMPPIYLTLGALNIANLSLNASCILPFSDGAALFKVGLSRPEAPFSITVGPYGGAGHLALYADAGGIIGFTASMEFGAIVDFRFGPLSGRGQVTAGIYIRSLKINGTRVSTIEGVFTAAGSANIAMFRISAMLQVRVGQQPSGGMAGSAVFTFSFSLGLKDIEFRFVIFKQESKGYGGGGMSGNASAALDDGYFSRELDGRERIRTAQASGDIEAKQTATWSEYGKPNQSGPLLMARTPTQDSDYAKYLQLFSEAEAWLPT